MDSRCAPSSRDANLRARRVAREMLTERGDDVAHQIRFDSTVSRATKCVFLTEGTLLRKLADDPDLVEPSQQCCFWRCRHGGSECGRGR